MQEFMLGKDRKEREFKKAVSFSRDSKNSKRAIDLFTLALEDSNYRVQSVDYLVDLYIKRGDYLHAREILNKYAEENNNLSWAKLENIENNYQSSKNYYEKTNDIELEQRLKLSLARIEFQLGNYKTGREILENLKYDKKYVAQILFEKCLSYMSEHNYKKGYETLMSIQTDRLKPSQASDYESMKFYFSYFLGKMDEQEIQDNLNRGYWIFRLLRDSDNALLTHIFHHKEGNKDAGTSPLINCIDLRELLDETRARISGLNPNHFNLVDYYMFHMNKPIGYVDGILTNDICVQNILGTDKILTMYPVLLSDEFDREGNGTSERLRRKRELGRKN